MPDAVTSTGATSGENYMATPPPVSGVTTANESGPADINNHNLPQELQNALFCLVMGCLNEDWRTRYNQLRRVAKAELYWQNFQYLWWDDNDGVWNFPSNATGSGLTVGNETQFDNEGMQYTFNIYTPFGETIIAALTQDLPNSLFTPSDVRNEKDVATAKAYSKVSTYLARSNRLLTKQAQMAYHLWTGPFVASYSRYVVDGNRFGFKDRPVLTQMPMKIGPDSYLCATCGMQEIADDSTSCPGCQQPLDQSAIQPAPMANVPVQTGTESIPKGDTVIDYLGALEIKVPLYANDSDGSGFDYVAWNTETPLSQLRAAFSHVADQIQAGASVNANEQYARIKRLEVKSGGYQLTIGDRLYNIGTLTRVWMDQSRFYSDDISQEERVALCKLFPNGAYVAFSGSTYLEARNENKRKHWRFTVAKPGAGFNRPGMGDILMDPQDIFNDLMSLSVEGQMYGSPPIFGVAGVIDTEAMANQKAEPSVMYATGKPPAGMSLSDAFYQPTAPESSATLETLITFIVGQGGQFQVGALPALFGGEMKGNDTAAAYAQAKAQALGRLGIVWKMVGGFHAQTMKCAADIVKENLDGDLIFSISAGDGSENEQIIRTTELMGNVEAYIDENAPLPQSWQEKATSLAALVKMFAEDPAFQATLHLPENQEYIKLLFGAEDLKLMGEDSRIKQMNEIKQLIQGQPIPRMNPVTGQTELGPSVAIQDTDDHPVEIATCLYFKRSLEGQRLLIVNPVGMQNFGLHLKDHEAAQAQASQGQGEGKPPSESMGFGDVPIDVQVQMAAKAGYKMNPAIQMAQDAQENAVKAEQAKSKFAGAGSPVQ